jgi:integrase
MNRELTVLKRAFSLALQSGKLLAKPHIPMLRENNARTGFFEADQLASVLAHLPAPIQPVIRFAAITGWRIADEVLPLEWRQVDFAAGEVRLDVGTTSEGRVFTTKNDEGRVFPITEELRAVLEAQHAEHLRLKQTGQIAPWVFVRLVAKGRGGATSPKRIRAFNKAWKAACTAAGAPDRIPHDLRRTAVRNLVRAGIPERVAMMMTGHKTRSVFERDNIVSSGDLKAAARSMDAFSTRAAGTPKTSGQGQFQGQSRGRRPGLPTK